MSRSPDLVVLSHLRWTWVWQRPQHIISRLARGRRVWFVEEPRRAGEAEPVLRVREAGPVTRVWLDLPGDPAAPEELGGAGHVGFDHPDAAGLGAALRAALPDGRPPVVWLYTPLGLAHVADIERAALVYDVMDDLAAFRNAPRALEDARRAALASADIVLTGGRSLDAGVRSAGVSDPHLFPSGVDAAHFASAATLRRPRERPVAGYVGVIDERLDLRLVEDLARLLPDWDVEMVGPLAKLGLGDLPARPNLRYAGMQPYDRLPAVMAGFDVALMPFALNEATRSISPTKTLEYVAAGLPVVSTRVPDVVTGFAALVTLADDAEGFAAACREALRGDTTARVAAARPILRRHDWNRIAARIERLVEEAAVGGRPGTRDSSFADPARAVA